MYTVTMSSMLTHTSSVTRVVKSLAVSHHTDIARMRTSLLLLHHIFVVIESTPGLPLRDYSAQAFPVLRVSLPRKLKHTRKARKRGRPGTEAMGMVHFFKYAE